MNAIAILEKYHIYIPDETTELKSYYEDGIDEGLWVRLQLSKSGLQHFVKKNNLSEYLSTESRVLRNFHLEKQEWWNPDDYNNFRAASIQQDNNAPYFGLNVLIGEKKDNSVVIFLFLTSL